MDITWNKILNSLEKRHRDKIIKNRQDKNTWFDKRYTKKRILEELEWDKDEDIIQEFIRYCSEWSKTPEGHKYWHQVYFFYENKLIKNTIWI